MPKLKRSIPKEPVKLKVKKGDTVEVIAGKDKGKRGTILQAFPKLNKVTVEGANMLTRHRKDRPSKSTGAAGQNQMIKGGRIQEESPLFTAKVMLVCPNCQKPTRVGYAFKEGDEKLSRRKYRICKHPECSKPIDTI